MHHTRWRQSHKQSRQSATTDIIFPLFITILCFILILSLAETCRSESPLNKKEENKWSTDKN